MKRILPKTMSALALAMVSAPGAWAQTAPPKLGDAANAELDSIQNSLDKYESMARRSMVGGGSKPVSFAGEAIGKIVGSGYQKNPEWMNYDATQFKNSFVALRMGMVASPNRNLRLWAKLGLNHGMLGQMAPSNKVGKGDASATPKVDTLPAGYDRSASSVGFNNSNYQGNLVYEDMAVGLVAKLGPTTWSTKFGGVLWNELSPLTVWKTQPRIFSWDYLPFELEQSTAQFYDYGTVKGEKSGRAAWNKKPFQGMQLESVDLPFGLYFNSFLGSYEGYGKNQTWLVPNDKNTELQYTDPSTGVTRSSATKGTGIGDLYRWSGFLRLAKTDLPSGLAAGVNWFGYMIDPDYPKQWEGTTTAANDAGATGFTVEIDTLGTKRYINNFYVAPQVASIDLRRTIPGGVSFHVDLAMSKADTVFYKVGKTTDTATALYREDMRGKVASTQQWGEIGQTNTGWVPGLYTTVTYPASNFEAELRTVYLPKKFQSPASIANPIDGIFPYEANMTGAGKFAGSDNGTAYASNLAGSNLIVKVPVPRGHAKISWGLHAQLEEGNDVIFFPWRQNGAAFNQTLASNFTQYDQGLLDDFLRSSGGKSPEYRQARRLGEEYYFGQKSSNSKYNPYSPVMGNAGGLRAAFLSAYEGFVPYKLTKGANQLDGSEADQALWEKETDVILKDLETGVMPTSKKFTQNLSFDGSYELSRLWAGKQSVFLGGYLAFNSITKDNRVGIPAFGEDDDNVLLMGRNIRLEPVFQVTPKFYVIGLLGNEVWKSKYGVAYIDSSTGKAPSGDADWDPKGSNLVSAPVDYTDWIYGLGFDWDMAARVGLHVRCQYFTHEDKGISKSVSKAAGINDYQAWLTTAEVKMWF